MLTGPRPTWVTFDCYGTLIQWDEGLLAAVETILRRKGEAVDAGRFIAAYDAHEHGLEQTPPHRSFKTITAMALERTMHDLGLPFAADDAATLTDAISAMPPHPEVLGVLGRLKAAGLNLCIVSNTDDAIIAGNIAQLGGHIDRVVTAQQAQAYKPSPKIFDHAHGALGIRRDAVVHVCASPHLDLVATRALGLRDVWIDRGTGRRPVDGYVPAATLPSLAGLPDLFGAAGWM